MIVPQNRPDRERSAMGVRVVSFLQIGRLCIALAVLVNCLPMVSLADEGELRPSGSQGVRFREDVYPLIENRCFRCHAGRESSSGVRLDRREDVLGETNGTPLVVVGHSDRSELVARVTSKDSETRMPPKGNPLTDTEVKLLKTWIDEGLDWDETLLPSAVEGSEHWAFQPVLRPPVP
ncbi:MAG: hypothetical protein KDA84_00140, partial [Planctomycetaceae bacterium]|nr:hypothetical protein [Planctomycetaceae bacterium]